MVVIVHGEATTMLVKALVPSHIFTKLATKFEWILFFVWGAMAVFAVLFPQIFTEKHFGANTLSSIFILAVLEEVFKFAPIVLFSRYIKTENILKYAVLAALGFAYIENLLFFWQPIINASIMFAWQRIFVANVIHLGNALVIAWFWKLNPKYLPIGLFLAIAIHFFFNTIVVLVL